MAHAGGQSNGIHGLDLESQAVPNKPTHSKKSHDFKLVMMDEWE